MGAGLTPPDEGLGEDATTQWEPLESGDAPLLEACRAWLATREMSAHQPGATTALRLDGSGKNGDWELWVATREQERVVLVWSVWPDAVPRARRPAVMELVTRLNPLLAVGTYELDLDTGRVRVRTGLELGDAPLLDDLLAGLVGSNVEVFDDHLPDLLRVLDGADAVEVLAAQDG